MASLILTSPLAGWALPIEEIPDPVFAQGMAGEGVGIDPTGSVLHAPCAGRVFPIAGSSHALSLRTHGGGEILLHLGIDTVALDGAGFQLLVAPGDAVESGQALLRFDLDLIARRAPSAVTPVVLPSGGRVVRSTPHRLLAVGDFLMEVDFGAAHAGEASNVGTDAVAGPAADDGHAVLSRSFRLPFEHGLHARPAAQLVAALRPFAARVELHARNGSANARSSIAMMALGTRHGEIVEVSARGSDAAAALDALAVLLEPASAPVAPVTPPATAQPSPPAAIGTLPGQIASRGLALGPVAYLQATSLEFAEHACAPAHERDRLHAAIAAVHAQLAAQAGAQQGVGRDILATHAELVGDPDLAERAGAHIAQGSSAAHAWRQAIAGASDALSALSDARMRERVADLRDIEHQVLLALAGKQPGAQEPPAFAEGAILLADELLPSQLIALDHGRLGGICTAGGGPTSHVAIIAAALGIPALVAVGPRLLQIAAGSVVWLDAERGFIQPVPGDEAQARLADALAAGRVQDAADLATAAGPCRTADGVHVGVLANLGAAGETRAAVARGADGCGLLRTEFLFLQRQSPPDEDEQFEQYRMIREQLAPRTFTIRTMDIGGDKPIPYLPLPAEENPALGLRGLRTSLAHPQLLRTQLRAILRLRSPASCRILLPMVTDLGDLRAVRVLLRECASELGIDELPRLGAMIETPASALLAEQLLEEADFLSIGSNDLSQYVLAMDRGHPQLSGRLDALHPAVLRLIESVAARGAARGREVAVCGGLGSDPEAIAVLVGLGIREVSAVPAVIPRIKRIIRSLDVVACRELARKAMNLGDAAAVRQLVAGAIATVTGTEARR